MKGAGPARRKVEKERIPVYTAAACSKRSAKAPQKLDGSAGANANAPLMKESLQPTEIRSDLVRAHGRSNLSFGLAAIAALALLMLAGSGCRGSEDAEQRRNTLVYGFGENFKTFDPSRQIYAQETPIIQQVLEPLLIFDNNLQHRPMLATSWETPDDCNTWIFHLRPDVRFHDGTPFNAQAVKWHFDRILDPATASTRRKQIDDVVSVDVIDDLTVAFRVVRPNCILPDKLTGAFASIPSPTAFQKYGAEIARNPVGTGPFVFESWTPDVAIRLRRNEDYWNKEQFHLQRLEFRPIRENTTRFILLEQGRLDMADVAFAQVKVAQGSDRMVLQTAPQLSIRYIGFNTQKPPFSDRRVRQAANYAVNKDDIVKYVFFGVGEPARGPLPSVLPSFAEDIHPYEYNPEKARQLLAEAGYPNGIDVTMWAMETGTYRATADAVVEHLRLVGIRARMNILDAAVYWDKFDAYLTPSGESFPTKDGVYDLYVGGWVGGETAHGFLEPLFKGGSNNNSSFYRNPEVDELLRTFKGIADPEERNERFRQMQRIIVQDAPWVFAFHGQVNTGLRPRVQNFKINSSGLLRFEDVRLADAEGGPSS